MTLIELDETGATMDSLFSANAVAAAPNHRPGSADGVISKLYFPLNEGSIANLLQTRKMIYRIRLNTLPSGSLVKFYNDDKMDVKIIGDFTYHID